MTDENFFNEVVYTIESWDNPEILRRQHQIGYSLVKKYTVRSKKYVEQFNKRSPRASLNGGSFLTMSRHPCIQIRSI
jgi:hypothetical protein